MSPPRSTDVLAHVWRLIEDIESCENGMELCRANGGAAPDVVFRSIFEWLDKATSEGGAESALSSDDLRPFKRRACVPVGDALVRASNLYFRLPSTELSPILFEVPRAFGSLERLLGRLGVKGEPSADDYSRAMLELQQEVGADVPLAINEVLASVEVSKQ